MKKLFFAIAFVLCSCLDVFSQATSLTIDCQTPGWLSSMINYGDQQTLVNLKVTGYINATDLSFIGSLSKNQQLHGVINLEEAQIVGATNEDNNKLNQGYFGGHIQHLILPKSLVAADKCLSGTSLDSLTIGGETLPVITDGLFYQKKYALDGSSFNKNVKHLILREGVTTISKGAFFYRGNKEECVFESITFPMSLVTIEELAFQNCFSLHKADLTDNIETIGDYAFANSGLFSSNDTIRLPNNLKTFYLSSIAREPKSYNTNGGVADIECYGNQHIYIPKNVVTIDGGYVRLFGSYEKCYLHINNNNPPSLIKMYTGMYSSLVVYVPKSNIDIYKSDGVWQNTTVLAEPNPAKSINIEQESIELVKGTTRQLYATVLPEDADDKYYTWSSSDYNVVTVSQDGLLTAVSSGEAKIYATLSADNTIIDSCTIKVFQPVNEVKLDITSKSVKVGETFVLKATIIPNDADNKKIIWSSKDSEIASVDASGNVNALKAGETWVKAVSNDYAEAKDSCKVTVIQPVTGIQLDNMTYQLNGIGESFELKATVVPDDASNNNVKWKSSDESVCIVSQGLVVAVGYGTCVIIATTEDGGYMATCTVTVNDMTGISTVSLDNGKRFQVYDAKGSKRTRLKKGVNIIHFVDGTKKKVIIR